MERNTLMAKCYPRIKDYCREKHGLEFQVNNYLYNRRFLLLSSSTRDLVYLPPIYITNIDWPVLGRRHAMGCA